MVFNCGGSIQFSRPLTDTGNSTPEVIVEKGTGRLVVILAGRPSDSSYVEAASRAADAMSSAREAAQFTKEECSHCRAEDSAAVNVGIYHGGGTGKPCNLDNGRHAEVMENLVRNPDVSRMAGFADSASPVSTTNCTFSHLTPTCF